MVELRTYTDDDLWLNLALETDPVAMAELGGPRSEAAVRDVHVRRLVEPWYFTITADGEPAGTIGAWRDDEEAETGWMVLPAFHGRGIASAALGLLLERLRPAKAYPSLNAYPGVANAPSNRLCEKHGFTLVRTFDGEWDGKSLRLNHWRLEL